MALFAEKGHFGHELRARTTTWTNRLRYELARDRAKGAHDPPVHRVAPHGASWIVVPEGHGGPVYASRSKQRALDKAIALARRGDGTLAVHRDDGSLQELRRPR